MTRTSIRTVCREFQDYLLTHPVIPCGPVPTALDPDGVYPYVSYCETADRPVPRQYSFVVLENKHLRVTIAPDLGGKVWSLNHKRSGKETLYVPEVIRPTRILPRFCFVAGGIEVSFPISHSPSQNEKVLYKIERTNDRVYVTCGERELRFGMQWSVEYSLGAEDTFLTQRVKLHNPGQAAHPWMSWSNAALPSAPDTEFHFPRGQVLRHASRVEMIDWQKQGPKRESEIQEMTGYFWKTRDANAFGAYTPSLGCGVYHVAEETSAPGMKLWSYGVGEDRSWATLSTASAQGYIEIQGGPIRDQSVKLELAPHQTHFHTEYWMPTDKPLDIYRLGVPRQTLREVEEIPLFEWARAEEMTVWDELIRAHQMTGPVPDPPDIEQNRWAPSGRDDLGSALEWAIGVSRGETPDGWRFQYGAWLAGRGETGKAVDVLVNCRLGIAKALLARIYRANGDIQLAASAFEQIREPWIQLHPQIVAERDRVLRELGTQSLGERKRWLDQVATLKDERVIERRVQLLIDQGEIKNARQLLLSTPFQKVHQTYRRTELWKQICEKLGGNCDVIPPVLGEDRLARFGAYREFERY